MLFKSCWIFLTFVWFCFTATSGIMWGLSYNEYQKYHTQTCEVSYYILPHNETFLDLFQQYNFRGLTQSFFKHSCQTDDSPCYQPYVDAETVDTTCYIKNAMIHKTRKGSDPVLWQWTFLGLGMGFIFWVCASIICSLQIDAMVQIRRRDLQMFMTMPRGIMRNAHQYARFTALGV